jgi:hypothetical protein
MVASDVLRYACWRRSHIQLFGEGGRGEAVGTAGGSSAGGGPRAGSVDLATTLCHVSVRLAEPAELLRRLVLHDAEVGA